MQHIIKTQVYVHGKWLFDICFLLQVEQSTDWSKLHFNILTCSNLNAVIWSPRQNDSLSGTKLFPTQACSALGVGDLHTSPDRALFVRCTMSDNHIPHRGTRGDAIHLKNLAQEWLYKATSREKAYYSFPWASQSLWDKLLLLLKERKPVVNRLWFWFLRVTDLFLHGCGEVFLLFLQNSTTTWNRHGTWVTSGTHLSISMKQQLLDSILLTLQNFYIHTPRVILMRLKS